VVGHLIHVFFSGDLIETYDSVMSFLTKLATIWQLGNLHPKCHHMTGRTFFVTVFKKSYNLLM